MPNAMLNVVAVNKACSLRLVEYTCLCIPLKSKTLLKSLDKGKRCISLVGHVIDSAEKGLWRRIQVAGKECNKVLVKRPRQVCLPTKNRY
jgi:hypothetical protein